jgi:hypothetical protein
MQNPEVIERRWPGFGECRITVAPCKASAPESMAWKAFAGVSRLLSRTGLGTLSFTVDPAWILEENHPLSGPIASQFLRVHRRALAEELRSRQPAPAAPKPPARSPVAHPRSAAIPVPVPVPAEKGLPTWFKAYCGPKNSDHKLAR